MFKISVLAFATLLISAPAWATPQLHLNCSSEDDGQLSVVVPPRIAQEPFYVFAKRAQTSAGIYVDVRAEISRAHTAGKFIVDQVSLAASNLPLDGTTQGAIYSSARVGRIVVSNGSSFLLNVASSAAVPLDPEGLDCSISFSE